MQYNDLRDAESCAQRSLSFKKGSFVSQRIVTELLQLLIFQKSKGNSISSQWHFSPNRFPFTHVDCGIQEETTFNQCVCLYSFLFIHLHEQFCPEWRWPHQHLEAAERRRQRATSFSVNDAPRFCYRRIGKSMRWPPAEEVAKVKVAMIWDSGIPITILSVEADYLEPSVSSKPKVYIYW